MAEAYLGEIRIFSRGRVPGGWNLCDGSSLPIASNDHLFKLIGTTYGGDGVTSFNLPDLRGRAAIQAGKSAEGATYTLGQSALGTGVPTTLTAAQLPSHTHAPNRPNFEGYTVTQPTLEISVTAGQTAGGDIFPASNLYIGHVPNPSGATPKMFTPGAPTPPLFQIGGLSATVSGNLLGTAVTVASTGGNASVDLRAPYLAINYIICIAGLIPEKP